MDRKISTLIASSVVASAIAVGVSGEVNAATVACSTSDLTGSIACEGPFSGNHSNSNVDGSFGISGWTEIFKVDSDSGTDGNLTVTGGGTSGGYTLTGLNTSLNYMIALKGGPSYSLYNLGSGITGVSGFWNTDGLFKGNGKPGPGLSNFAVYQADSTPVPEPMTILGTVVALGLGGVFKSKHAKSEE